MPRGERAGGPFDPLATLFEGRRGVLLTALLVPLLLALILWLPPVSLPERLLERDYVALPPAGVLLRAADGAQLAVPGVARRGEARLRLSNVPREQAGQALGVEALAALPDHLEAHTFYVASVRGAMPASSHWTLPLPADGPSSRLLDAYGWTGEEWEWLPRERGAGEQALEVSAEEVPLAVVLAEARPRQGEIRVEASGEWPEGLAASVPTLASPRLYLIQPGGLLGQIFEEAEHVAPGMRLVPVLHNVEPSGRVRGDLVNEVLAEESLWRGHVDQIAALVAERAYDGIVIDYREIDPAHRQPFSRFVTALAGRLERDDKLLGVRLAAPAAVGERFETGAYDWRAIGHAASFVQVPLTRDPEESVAAWERLLGFATGQVERYKLEWELPVTAYRLLADESIIPVPYTEVVSLLAEATGINEEELRFLEDPFARTLPVLEGSGRAELDPETATYRLQVGSEPLYLADIEQLARLLEVLRSYQVGNVAVPDASALAPRWWELLGTYRALGAVP